MNYKLGRPFNIFKPHYAFVGTEVYIRKYDPRFFRWVYNDFINGCWVSQPKFAFPLSLGITRDKPVWVPKKEWKEQEVRINGKYAIRRWGIYHNEFVYKDLAHKPTHGDSFWWTERNIHDFFKDCLSDTPILTSPVPSRIIDFERIINEQ